LKKNKMKLEINPAMSVPLPSTYFHRRTRSTMAPTQGRARTEILAQLGEKLLPSNRTKKDMIPSLQNHFGVEGESMMT